MKIDGVEEAIGQNREEITSEMHSAVDAAQNVIITHLEYVLEQSTAHRRSVEHDLKETRDLTDELRAVSQREFQRMADAINDIHETSQQQVSKMAITIWALIAVNITMAITLLVHTI